MVVFLSVTPSLLCLVAIQFELMPIAIEGMLGFVVLYVMTTGIIIAFLMRRHRRASSTEEIASQEEETTSDPPKYEDAVAQEIFGTVSQTTLSLEGGQNDVLNSDISFAYPEPPPPYHESVTTPLVDNEEDSGTM